MGWGTGAIWRLRGGWSAIDLRDVLDLPGEIRRRELEVLREALGAAIPTRKAEDGFEDRVVPVTTVQDRLRAVRSNRYGALLRDVARIVGRERATGFGRRTGTAQDGERLARRYGERLDDDVAPREAWALEQIGQAALLLREIDAIGESGDPEDDIDVSEEIGLGVLGRKGLSSFVKGGRSGSTSARCPARSFVRCPVARPPFPITRRRIGKVRRFRRPSRP